MPFKFLVTHYMYMLYCTEAVKCFGQSIAWSTHLSARRPISHVRERVTCTEAVKCFGQSIAWSTHLSARRPISHVRERATLFDSIGFLSGSPVSSNIIELIVSHSQLSSSFIILNPLNPGHFYTMCTCDPLRSREIHIR
jgi:hypothetical protein